MNTSHKLKITILSALMHDIGKFAQRANAFRDSTIENTYCVKKAGSYSRAHTVYGHPFLCSSDFPLPEELKEQQAEIARYASAHHNPGVSSDAEGKRIEEIICIADRLSSGLDRIRDETQAHDFKKAHLQSVFNQIKLQSKSTQEHWLKLQPMGKSKSLFPSNQKLASSTDYAQLYDMFINECKTIPCDEGYKAYLSSLIAVLEKYTYCIPSCTYKTEPDISLFDHSATTAAIAQALYVAAQEHHPIHQEQLKEELKEQLKEQRCILFAAELSGIQKYIFTGEKGKGYAKILRARSFHLQVVTRGILLSILEKLELYSVAKIMDAGGKFMLLLPCTQKTHEALKSIEKELEAYFAKEFFGELKMITAQIELCQDDLKQKTFITKLDAINDLLEQNKLGLNKHFLQEQGAVYTIDFPDGICDYCNRNPARPEFSDEDGVKCKTCHDLITIGKVLPHSTYGLFSHIPPHNLPFIKVFKDLFLSLDNQKKFARADIIDALEQINIAARTARGKYTSYSIAGYIPRNEQDAPLLFEELAEASKNTSSTQCSAQLDDSIKKTESHTSVEQDNYGVALLGALKADVDNLGLLFSLGFDERLSISRFAMLSRMLNAFFSEHLIDTIENERLNIYTVFTGGDDLFVLGAWTDIVHFASILHKDFAEFTGHNPDITISAGIALCKSKLPVPRIAEMAEEALEHAKSCDQRLKSQQSSGKKLVKNACTLFGITTSWSEFENQMKDAQWLIDAIHEKKIPQGLVRRLLHYADECQQFQNNGKIRHGLYISHLKYDLARNVNNEDIKNKLIAMTKPESFLHARMAISYALYNTRK